MIYRDLDDSLFFGLHAVISIQHIVQLSNIWTARIWILQLHHLSRIHDHMFFKQMAAACSDTGHCHQTEVLHVAAPMTPLSAECPESGCQPRHTIMSGQYVSFEARQNTESTQPDSSTTVQSPSGTQDGLCLHISNTSSRTRKNSSPKKTFN